MASSGAARADIVDDLANKLKSYQSLGIDPDQVEMARYSIKHPNEAATIYSRAAAQDYPFFALVGAAKAAKDKQFPAPVGVFTRAKCEYPITAIDTVFAGASSKVSQGKPQTNAAMAEASAIASQYSETMSNQAKAELIQTLNENVPYFGDIKTICSFAFETDFQIETDIQQAVGNVSKTIRKSLLAFKSGDVITGVTTLIAAGVSKDIACDLVDSAVSGGVISKTPVLGELVKGACKGFVGKVLDGAAGIVKGTVVVVKDSAGSFYYLGEWVQPTGQAYGTTGAGGTQEAYITLPMCSPGSTYSGDKYPTGYGQSCECPSPTKVWANGEFWPFGAVFPSSQYKCIACPPGTALQNGQCSPCATSGAGSNYTTYKPNPAGTACVISGGGGTVSSPCAPNEKWFGGQGAEAVCCPSWAKLGANGKSCAPICNYDMIFSGGQCQSCPDNTRVIENSCTPCPSGTHSTAGGSCIGAFPAMGCGPNQIHPNGNQYSCTTCPPGTAANADHSACRATFPPPGQRVTSQRPSAGPPVAIGRPIIYPGMQATGAPPPQASGRPVSAPAMRTAPRMMRQPDCAAQGAAFYVDESSGRCRQCPSGQIANAARNACAPIILRVVPEVRRPSPGG